MNTRNKNLHEAKRNKNDEFYTRYEDIEKELKHYKEYLKGKTVYCPCDDWRWSNFVRYFKDHFKELGIKKLYASNFDIGEGSYKYSYDGKIETVVKNSNNGDFSLQEDMINACDIVVTNPPFSLFRKFIDWLTAHDKDFLIIGPLTALQYTNVFKLIKEGKIFTGINTPTKFIQRETEEKNPPMIVWIESKFVGLNSIQWYNSMERKKYATLTLTKTYKGHEEEYPKYDNFEAINVDRIKDIPYDYEGVMGVPITFLKGYYPEYEIMDLHSDTAIRGGGRMEVQESDSKKKTVEVIGMISGLLAEEGTGVITPPPRKVVVREGKEEVQQGADKVIRYKGQYEIIGVLKGDYGALTEERKGYTPVVEGVRKITRILIKLK